MTSKERAKAALSHIEADRVPIGEFETEYPMIEKVLGRRTFWRAKLRRIKALWDGGRDEVVESEKKDIVEYTKKLELDIVPVSLCPSKNAKIEKLRQIDKWTFEDHRGNIYRYFEETQDIMLVKRGKYPTNFSPGAQDLPPPLKSLNIDDSQLELIRHVVQKLGKTHFILGDFGGAAGIWYPSVEAYGEKWLLRIIDDPKGMAVDEMQAVQNIQDKARILLNEGCDAVIIGYDYGHNTGPFMSPKQFQDIFSPALKFQCDKIHALSSPVFFHCCGNNRIIMDKIVDAGIDVYQSLQPMEKIEELKKMYGDRITLWGGVDADALCTGRPKDIKYQVRFAIEHCALGGGFILGSSHSVMLCAKYENYMAMLEEARK